MSTKAKGSKKGKLDPKKVYVRVTDEGNTEVLGCFWYANEDGKVSPHFTLVMFEGVFSDVRELLTWGDREWTTCQWFLAANKEEQFLNQFTGYDLGTVLVAEPGTIYRDIFRSNFFVVKIGDKSYFYDSESKTFSENEIQEVIPDDYHSPFLVPVTEDPQMLGSKTCTQNINQGIEKLKLL